MTLKTSGGHKDRRRINRRKEDETLCTTAFAWLLTRRLIDPHYRTVLIPGFGVFGLLFGAWYVGIG